MFLPEWMHIPVDWINLLRDVSFSLVQSFNVCLCDISAETKLTVDVRSELQAESLLSLIVLQTQTGLVEGPGL